jgi:hypothetical protein
MMLLAMLARSYEWEHKMVATNGTQRHALIATALSTAAPKGKLSCEQNKTNSVALSPRANYPD